MRQRICLGYACAMGMTCGGPGHGVWPPCGGCARQPGEANTGGQRISGTGWTGATFWGIVTIMSYPAYTLSERIADGCLHIIGVSAGVSAVVILLVSAVPALPPGAVAALVVYGVAMVAMFSCSAAYHLIPVPAWKGILRRIDQAAIFLKIAGTYTPFAFIKMGGVWGYSLLGTVWTVALAGALAKLLLTAQWDRLSIALYLVLGWAGLAVFQPLLSSISVEALILLGTGGALYSLGVIFHLAERLPFHNAIWHFFVLAGTACHFSAVVSAVFE